MSRLEQIAARARERFPETITEARIERGQDVLVVDRGRLVEVLMFLRDDAECSFDMLSDVSAADWLGSEPRFHVNYHLYSFAWNVRLRVKVGLPEADPRVPSSAGVWPTANWQEREVYDLMGITFAGHPDLRRILLPDEWEGHPHRKDYPTGGVPVEYKIEPAYLGDLQVSGKGRPAAGGMPSRLRRDRGKQSPWTWTGPPSFGIRRRNRPDEDAAQ